MVFLWHQLGVQSYDYDKILYKAGAGYSSLGDLTVSGPLSLVSFPSKSGRRDALCGEVRVQDKLSFCQAGDSDYATTKQNILLRIHRFQHMLPASHEVQQAILLDPYVNRQFPWIVGLAWGVVHTRCSAILVSFPLFLGVFCFLFALLGETGVII